MFLRCLGLGLLGSGGVWEAKGEGDGEGEDDGLGLGDWGRGWGGYFGGL